MKADMSPAPLYEKVKRHMLDLLASGQWAMDQRLPSEHELVALLGVSRMTVNRALRELTSEGHLQRIQGVGTFVAPPRPQAALIEINDIGEEIRARGQRHRSEVILLERIDNPAPDLLARFERGSMKAVAHSIVSHFENDVPVLLEERFVNPELAPDYLDQDFTAVTTYDYLSQRVPLTEVEHVISAVSAGKDLARLLRLRVGEPCLLLHRRTWWNRVVVTVNNFTYAGNRYVLGSRYVPNAPARMA
jgi:GntR family transcriptional regulator, histidine utilization repressor